MYTNETGKAFFHPVDNRLIKPGQAYDIPAHLPHENVPVEAEVGEKAETTTEKRAREKAEKEAKKAETADSSGAADAGNTGSNDAANAEAGGE